MRQPSQPWAGYGHGVQRAGEMAPTNEVGVIAPGRKWWCCVDASVIQDARDVAVVPLLFAGRLGMVGPCSVVPSFWLTSNGPRRQAKAPRQSC